MLGRLAGLAAPSFAPARAAALVQQLETASRDSNTADTLPLFDMLQSDSTTCLPTGQVTVSERLAEMLDELEPDAFSPRKALSLLYELKAEYDKADR